MRIPEGTHYELMNWSRACWSGTWPHPLPATKCGSLEGDYRAPPEWDTLDEPVIRPNFDRAAIVQAVFDKLPEDERFVLLAEYPQRERYGRTEGKATAATRLGYALWHYNAALAAAAGKVEAAFEGVAA